MGTMTTSMAVKVISTHLSKSSRLKCASISSNLGNAHLRHSVNLLMDQVNSDSQMTHFQRTSERLPLEPFTPTTKPNLAKCSWLERNANSEMDAHSTTLKPKEESSLTLSQISQKESPFLQCLRR